MVLAIVPHNGFMDARSARLDAAAALQSGEYMDAVRQTMDWFATLHPGRSVEVRVPPFRVIQILGGTTHRRGTPPAVVEMAPASWLALVAGTSSWDSLRDSGAIRASGERSNLAELFADLDRDLAE
jgi:hypothetical protein